jgi:nickel/cobalt transporter (NicO) family protein
VSGGVSNPRRPYHSGMRRVAASLLALAALLVAPAAVLAHPLGNFTINHYAGIRVGPDAIRLDVVLDRAEIPTFQERLRLDLDADGEVSDAEIASSRQGECRALTSSLALTLDGTPAALEVAAAGLS